MGTLSNQKLWVTKLAVFNKEYILHFQCTIHDRELHETCYASVVDKGNTPDLDKQTQPLFRLPKNSVPLCSNQILTVPINRGTPAILGYSTLLTQKECCHQVSFMLVAGPRDS
jgi:hypothetical protein